MTRLFLRYGRDVVQEVVRDLPLTRDKEKGWDGIPSMARIAEALTDAEGRRQRMRERDNRIERQLAERKEYERARADAPTREEFVEKYPDIARRLGLLPPLEKQPEPVEQVIERLGITKEVWDSIPASSTPLMT